MGQRKLTYEEMESVTAAKCNLLRIAPITKEVSAFHDALRMINGMANHGTTDGKPYVDPQPEIGEGYRVATEADRDRGDMEIYIGDGWARRENVIVPHVHLKYFRVPVDRIPTDDDARQRPLVMVRMPSTGAWGKCTLMAVDDLDKGVPFLCKTEEDCRWFVKCRFPYPGE